MNDKLNINILINTFGGGGAERVVSELARNPPSDVNTSVSIKSDQNMCYSVEGVNLIVYDKLQDINFISKLLYKISPDILYYIYIHYYNLRKNNYDISVSLLTRPNIINMVISKILNIPCIVSVRNNMEAETSSKILLNIQKILFKLTSPYLIVNSKENQKWINDNFQLDTGKSVVIYNPKNIVEIQQLSKEVLSDTFFQTDELILITVGRLVPQKGHIHLLRVFYHLRKNIPCRLVICGTGILDDTLKKIASELNISESVYFAGFCENPFKYIYNSDVFVLPSLYEGQPNALIEALICGCPIVSTDCNYGPREILDNGKYGVLTKRLDVSSHLSPQCELSNAETDMYDKILSLLRNETERIKYRNLSTERICLFEKDMIINEYYDYFREVSTKLIIK